MTQARYDFTGDNAIQLGATLTWSLVWKFGSAILAAWILSACGGGGGGDPAPTPTQIQAQAIPASYTRHVLVQPEDRIILDEASFDTSILITREPDPVKSVALQAQQPGDIILTIGWTRETGFVDTDLYLAEAKRNPRFTHAYLYDEMFWTGGVIKMGHDEDAINNAAKKARMAGFKTVVSISPDVVLQGDFALKEVNAVDVIAIDPYFTVRAGDVVPTCRTGPNFLTNLLDCSAQKLRSMGYTGEIWYVAQAFGDSRVSRAEMLAGLHLQRETIAEAPSFGITGFVPFGLYFGVIENQREPLLYPLVGTGLDSLVRPPFYTNSTPQKQPQ